MMLAILLTAHVVHSSHPELLKQMVAWGFAFGVFGWILVVIALFRT